MFQHSYREIDAAEKLGVATIAHTPILYTLIDIEIALVVDALCNLTPGNQLDLMYAVTQQRLIALRDLKDFFEQVKEETTPQHEPE